jgi:hypothetical protein
LTTHKEKEIMTTVHRVCGLAAVGAALTLILALVWLTSAVPVSADPGLQCVNETGTGCDPACGGNCHNAIQKAIDHAAIGDEIRVAGGTYTMLAGTVAHIEKELWITGGYDPACSQLDPDLYATVLDGQGLGPVVEIVDAGDVGLAHLTITGGNGTGTCTPNGCGGGIYVENSTLHLGHSLLTGNVANAGIEEGRGGGLYATNSEVEVWESHVVSNTAQINPEGSRGYGGGIYIEDGAASLRQNLVLDNRATIPGSGYGGGIYLDYMDYVDVLTNVIEGNYGNPVASFVASYGGGLYVRNSDAVTVAGNTVLGNYTNSSGGGIGIRSSRVHVARNRIMDNTSRGGGGIKVEGSDPVTLTNNLIVHNMVNYKGGGLYASHNDSTGCRVVLFNNTIADNAPSAIATRDYATLTMTNNIVTGHELGIDETDPASSTVVADTNLFLNELDPFVGANPIQDDPKYGPDYHPLVESPAINAGLPIPWLTVDLDGAPRPQEELWDLGAYEGAWMWRVMLPLIQNGQALPPTLIFDDDFDDGTLSSWTSNLGTWTNPGNHMRGEYATGNAWNIRSSTGGDIVYQGTVNLLSGNAVGLVFRSSADGTSSYDVILDAEDNVFKISKRPPYTVLDSYSMSVQRNHPYQIKVVANGDTIDAYLDGVKRLTTTDTTYTTGHLGVILFQATATYDDLAAWALP